MATGTSLGVRAMGAVHRTLYRATGGRLGGSVQGNTVILLTTTGRKSGKPRTTPLSTIKDGDDLVIVGSNGGSDSDPQWLRNLRANPNVSYELGKERIAAIAEIVSDEEKQALWAKHAQLEKSWGGYHRKTSRNIPVVRLRS